MEADMSLAHLSKLESLLENPKLPKSDLPKLKETVERYEDWVNSLDALNSSGDELVEDMVQLTNAYKFFVEFDLIYSAEDDFLYRQKGQLKLDNSILEEFLPRLANEQIIPGLKDYPNLLLGPQKCLSGLTLGPVWDPLSDGGIVIRGKDQDFAVSRPVHIHISEGDKRSSLSIFETTANVGYFVAELKTNLDKTMFQEASATASDLKRTVPDAIYLLVCEWLDMPPVDTRLTSLDEAVVLRKAKRLPANRRAEFSSHNGRASNSTWFRDHLTQHPIEFSSIMRIVHHLRRAFPETYITSEDDVLSRGYF